MAVILFEIDLKKNHGKIFYSVFRFNPRLLSLKTNISNFIVNDMVVDSITMKNSESKRKSTDAYSQFLVGRKKKDVCHIFYQRKLRHYVALSE